MYQALCVVIIKVVVAAAAFAQAPPLTPTTSITINASGTQGLLSYSRIDVPAGVTVQFTGDYPIQIRCAGDATIAGTISVGASSASGGPGEVTLGAGSTGSVYTLPAYCGFGTSGSNGRHAGVYGATLPFSLAGGSPGGGVNAYGFSPFSGPCSEWLYYNPGGGGGGTLVLEADGVIDVSGSVEANGMQAWWTNTGAGSGGSILLRGMGGLTVRAGGLVAARPGPSLNSSWPAYFGLIRLDAYGQQPNLIGVVDPAPHVLRLPYLMETQAPTIGATWDLQVVAPAGDGVFLAASFQPGSFTSAYGTVGIDVATAITFGLMIVPATGHDPIATLRLPVPNVPALVGLNLWTAGLDWNTAQPPRYTNTLQSTVH